MVCASRRVLLKKILVLAVALIVGLSTMTFAGNIGIVLDTGGLGDLSFNDAAYAGVTRAVTEFGFDGIVFIESNTAADYLPNLRSQAQRDDIDLIIGVGWLLTESIELVASEYPEKKFANIDGWVPDAANVRGFMFKEGDGSAIIGALAAFQALEEGFDKVGVIFGYEGPVMYHFEAGYRLGIDWALRKYQSVKGVAAKPSLTLLFPYSNSFSDPAIGSQIMTSQIAEGVVGSYNVSGGVGIGMMQAVAGAHVNAGTTFGPPYYFGVDQNQDWWELGQYCPMSMLKRVDSATYEACKMIAEDTWEAGRSLLGIAEAGVYVSNAADLAREIDVQIAQGGIDAADQYTILANWAANRANISSWIWDALEELEASIIDGSYVIPFADTLTDIEAVRAQYPLN